MFPFLDAHDFQHELISELIRLYLKMKIPVRMKSERVDGRDDVRAAKDDFNIVLD